MLFWVKIALVALLLANGYLLTRTEHALLTASNSDALWHRMRFGTKLKPPTLSDARSAIPECRIPAAPRTMKLLSLGVCQ